MKPHLFILLFFLLLLWLPALAQEQHVVVPYTLADRDRAILTDAKISALEDKMEDQVQFFLYIASIRNS
jgi:hypothetical protein